MVEAVNSGVKLNSFAQMCGYAVGTPKVDFDELDRKQRAEGIEFMRCHIVGKLGGGKADEAKKLELAFDRLHKKYKDELEEGTYSIMSVDDLLALDKGQIVDADGPIIVWCEREYIDFDEMDELE